MGRHDDVWRCQEMDDVANSAVKHASLSLAG